jgi:hypothetical protein
LEPTDANYETFSTSYETSLDSLLEEGYLWNTYEISCIGKNDCTNCTLSLTSYKEVTPGPDHPDDPDTSTKSIRWRRQGHTGAWNYETVVTINNEDETRTWADPWKYPYVYKYGVTIITISAKLFHEEDGLE